MSVTHIELFAGVGGFRQAMLACQKDHGVVFDCQAYSEIDPHALAAYRSLFETSGEWSIGDIEAFVSNDENLQKLNPVALVTGGFPCQSFSMMGRQGGFRDPRGNLFFCILKILERCQPRFVLLENVKNLKTHENGQTFKVIVASLEELGYRVFSDIFNSANFELAQTRNRIYIFATKDEIPSDFNFTQSAIEAFFKGLERKSTVVQHSVKDVLNSKVDTKYFLSEKILKTVLSDGSAGFHAKSEINLPIARPLCATMAKMHRACQDNYYSQDFINRRVKMELPPGKTTVRRLTPCEAFRLQGMNEEAVERICRANLSDSALYRLAGNAVSVNVVYAILSYLSLKFNWKRGLT